MNLLTHAAMFGWVPLVLLLFLVTPLRHRAVITAFIVGWLFLPLARYDLPGMPDWTKVTATNFTVLLAVLIVDLNRVLLFRPRWYDLPVTLFCISPFFTSIVNDLGPYDGLSAMLEQCVLWGIPYFIGRLYFTDRRALIDLGIGMIIGAIAYVPFCLFEMRMAPMLHKVIYGFSSQVNWEAAPMLGPLQWRPHVFMATPFSVTMFLGMAALVAYWFWRTGLRRQIYGVPMFWIFGGLLAMTVLCKVWSGIILTFGGLALLTLCWYWPTRAFLIALLLAPPMYMVTRGSGNWSGEAALVVVSQISERRAESLKTRFDNEDQLVDKALREPILGWGRWGRSRIRTYEGKDMSLTDGLWVITLGQYGTVGLLAVTAMFLLPLGLFIYRYPPWSWKWAMAAPLPFAVMLGLHMSDNLLNAFPNPLFTMMAGGIAAMPSLGVLAAKQRQAMVLARRRRRPAASVAQPAPDPAIPGVSPQRFPQH